MIRITREQALDESCFMMVLYNPRGAQGWGYHNCFYVFIQSNWAEFDVHEFTHQEDSRYNNIDSSGWKLRQSNTNSYYSVDHLIETTSPPRYFFKLETKDMLNFI